MQTFIRRAAALLPFAGLCVASADRLPFLNGSFDIVVQSTVFSSIMDGRMRQAVADEMCRVLAPGGIIVWYDMRYRNPRNNDVRPVGAQAIKKLFPAWEIDRVSVTLIPPLARHLARWSVALCYLLEWALPPARSHYLAVLRRPPA